MQREKKRAAGGGLWLLLLLVALSAHAAGVIRVSAEHSSPLAQLSQHVLDEAYGQLGLRLQVEMYPLQRALVAANDGDVDGELSRIAGVDLHYPNLVRVPVPINVADMVAVARDPCLSVAGWQSLRRYRIGFVRGTLIAEKNTRGMKVTRVNRVADLLPTLEAGHVDLIVVSRLDAMDYLAHRRQTDLHILEPSLQVVPLYHYLNRKHAGLVPRLQQVLQRMQKEGRIAALRRETLARIRYRPPLQDCAESALNL